LRILPLNWVDLSRKAKIPGSIAAGVPGRFGKAVGFGCHFSVKLLRFWADEITVPARSCSAK
jgi:hypothetical protein